MRTKFSLQFAVGVLLCGLAACCVGLRSAQAATPQVANGNFEQPLDSGPENWKVLYILGGPNDFAVKGRSTASRNSGQYGGGLKPYHDGRMHACLAQTVSNLVSGAAYAVTSWMRTPGGGDEGWYSKVHTYCETVGALGTVRSADATNAYQKFVITNRADAAGSLQIRLHFEKSAGTSGDKWFYIDGWFDDVSIALASPVNTPPVANDQTVTGTEDTATSIILTATDADNDPLTYVLLALPGHGTLSGIPPNLSYLPNTNYFGPDSFTFKVNDGHVDSSAATLSITINPANDRPTAEGQSLVVNEDTPVSFVLSGADTDGDPLTFTIVTPPQHGTLIGTPPNLVYQAAANYFGPDSLSFKVSDGQLDSDVARVTLDVLPVNDAPIAFSQSLEVDEDSLSPILLAGSDADGDPLTFVIVSPPAHGTLSGTPPNVSYTGQTNYSGPDSFSFKVNDGKVDSVPATVSLLVRHVNTPPVAIAEVSPLFPAPDFITNLLVLSPNNKSAKTILDGSRSWDADNDPLEFHWFITGQSQPFASAIRTTNVFITGEYRITLVVSDSEDVGTTNIPFHVIRPAEAVVLICATLDREDISPRHQQPICASANASIAAFERGNFTAGVNTLQALIYKVQAQIAPVNPVLARELIRMAEYIITVVRSG